MAVAIAPAGIPNELKTEGVFLSYSFQEQIILHLLF